ncbi:heat-inducible transcriptional repressor HrcA [Parahaliea aestuarii]|uniref:Heat-inducible transcription repressor HrcA n=1 Tax=Parahaliea aestuarii TaxID=1852021 RepID=A0A5C8ZPH3_9GAMM|nr:heat-inducible transcriptional repressor HrcA [Parahaliea aestuarii]TXS90135.1 heat-inducible transcription repressor HrcA [Parahaliea aestuarii]
MAAPELSERALTLLRALVQRHIRDGQPVGSRTLLEEAGLPVSAATVRNVMSDLEERGFLHSPHTSAGRVPTVAGYRLFVDQLLQVQPLESEAIRILREELNPDRPAGELVQSASNLVSAITAHAGLITVPRPEASQLRQVEFLPLSGNRVLAILVVNEREVQNRIIHTQRPFSEKELKEAARLVNQRFAGQALSLVQERILREMEEARSRIDTYLQAALDLASQALDQDEDDEDDYLVAGESRLLGNATAGELSRLRELFDAFEQKKDLLHLLERCSRAEGVQIFIGEEAGYEVFGDYSVITAPYGDGSRTLGVLGVIGPTRMAYERVIPIVDVTARLLSSALSH